MNFEVGAQSIKMTKITLNDFLPLYSELMAQKFKYNPKLLRQLKRDIYKLVTTNEPVDRFQIQDIEDDEGLDKVGVLAGIGVVTEQSGGDRGHHIPDPAELFCDVVLDSGNFDLKSLVENALPKLQCSHSHSLPLQKYVNAYRREFGKEPPSNLLNDCKSSADEHLSSSLQKQRRKHPIASMQELQQLATTDEKWFELFPRFQNFEKVLPELERFLRAFLKKFLDAPKTARAGFKTNIRRVIRIYDQLKYG